MRKLMSVFILSVWTVALSAMHDQPESQKESVAISTKHFDKKSNRTVVPKHTSLTPINKCWDSTNALRPDVDPQLIILARAELGEEEFNNRFGATLKKLDE
ncbi:MAG TPA: hypothetical protein VHO47_01130 [Candidatus Babeliales bacterium]|nr:hypothetical protein [Candidatus Babeliales bacterium]